jgi:hypothetical protein
VLTDLAALVPPFLVCAAFLTAVVAFLRHEMRDAKKQGDGQLNEVDEPAGADRAGDRSSGSVS